MRLRDRVRSANRIAQRYRTSRNYGGYHLSPETLKEEATNGHIWIYGDQRKYDAGPNTPCLDAQRVGSYRWNPTATYGGWVRDVYRVSGRH